MPGKVKMIIHKPINIKDFREDNINNLIKIAKERIGSVLPQ